MNRNVKMRLDLISAKAKQLSEDYGRLWEGDLAKGLNEIYEQLEAIRREEK